MKTFATIIILQGESFPIQFFRRELCHQRAHPGVPGLEQVLVRLSCLRPRLRPAQAKDGSIGLGKRLGR